MEIVEGLLGFAVKEFWGFAVVLGLFLAFMLVAKITSRATSGRAARSLAQHAEKSEAMFRSMFPDLQPHFHPARLHEFVKGRRARGGSSGRFTWKNPPGFAAARAEVEPEGTGEHVRVLDAAGVLLADFMFEEHAEGGVLRVGKGKFTVNIRDTIPRVRYWHPDREFKWTPNSWKFQSRMADDSIDSSDRGTSWSDSSSSSSSSSLGRTAAAAGIVGAGGAFDGGGASQGWDGAAGGGETSADSSSGATATSY